jgi:hypothetical protein
MDFETEAGSVWKITVIYVYADGSREQADNCPRTYAGSSAPWPVNPGAHDKQLVEIIVIKTLVTNAASQINMTVTPVTPIGPEPLLPNTPEPFSLPPGFYNITDVHDFPWWRTWIFNYTIDTWDHLFALTWGYWNPDSFFDIFFEIDGEMVLNHTRVEVGAVNPYDIPFDPDGTWPLGMYNITIRQSTIDSVMEGTIEDIPYLPDGWSSDFPQHHAYGELIPQDSNQHRTTGDRWFTTDPTNASAFEYFLTVGPEFNLTADWNMELYVATDLSAPIRTTVGDYVAGDWPRTLGVPTILDPDWSEDGFVLRVIYDGEYAIGMLEHAVDEVPGSAIGDPIWHTFQTMELLNIPMPYVVTGELFINVTVPIGTPLEFWFNDTAQTHDLIAAIWDGGSWVPMIDEGSWYHAFVMTTTDVICIRITPGTGVTFIEWLWSDFGS